MRKKKTWSAKQTPLNNALEFRNVVADILGTINTTVQEIEEDEKKDILPSLIQNSINNTENEQPAPSNRMGGPEKTEIKPKTNQLNKTERRKLKRKDAKSKTPTPVASPNSISQNPSTDSDSILIPTNHLTFPAPSLTPLPKKSFAATSSSSISQNPSAKNVEEMLTDLKSELKQLPSAMQIQLNNRVIEQFVFFIFNMPASHSQKNLEPYNFERWLEYFCIMIKFFFPKLLFDTGFKTYIEAVSFKNGVVRDSNELDSLKEFYIQFLKLPRSNQNLFNAFIFLNSYMQIKKLKPEQDEKNDLNLRCVRVISKLFKEYPDKARYEKQPAPIKLFLEESKSRADIVSQQENNPLLTKMFFELSSQDSELIKQVTFAYVSMIFCHPKDQQEETKVINKCLKDQFAIQQKSSQPQSSTDHSNTDSLNPSQNNFGF